MKRIAYISLSLLILTLLGCKKHYTVEENYENSSTKKVTVQELKAESSPIAITASGILTSEAEISLSFKIGGVVKGVYVEEGQFVKKGQLLAQLDMAEINAQVVQARNNFEKAGRDLERINNLFADTVATLEQKQDAQTGFEVARAALEIAEFNQKYARIAAPVRGKVLKRTVENHELVNPGIPMFLLGSLDDQGAQVIQIGLADKDIVQVALNDTATVSFDAFPDNDYPARVSEISEAANPATGTFQIELTLEGNYYHELKNGFVGKVSLFPSGMKAYYRIPMTALVEGNEKQAKVFLTRDQETVHQEILKVSAIHGNYFTVSQSEVKTPAWIVLEGAAYLNEKDNIEVLED